MASMDADQARLNTEIASLSEHINTSAAEIGTMEASQHTLTERGYELENQHPRRHRLAPTPRPSNWSAPPPANAATRSAWPISNHG